VGFVPEKKKKKRRERAGEKALRGDTREYEDSNKI
jgi:hypothetical protein